MLVRRLCGEHRYPSPLLAVAGYGLPGATRALPRTPIDERRWHALLAAAATHRMTGLLLAAVNEKAFPVTAEQTRQAEAAHRSAVLRALSLRGELVMLVEELSTRGIDLRVLKGPAVAALDYRRLGVRTFIDIDILVQPADIDSSVRHLTELGYQRTLAQPRPGFDRRFDKGVTMRGRTGSEVDLHRTFVLGPWGMRVDLDDLWEQGERFEIGNRTMYALSGTNRFLHACFHGALGNWPLRVGSLRDVAEMLPAAERDHAAVVERAVRWGAGAVVAAAVSDTLRLLGLEASGELAGWAQRHVPSRREQAWLALHTRSDKTFPALVVATVPVVPGLRNKLDYLRALAFPDAAYTAGRHASAARRFGYAIREARRGRTSRGEVAGGA